MPPFQPGPVILSDVFPPGRDVDLAGRILALRQPLLAEGIAQVDVLAEFDDLLGEMRRNEDSGGGQALQPLYNLYLQA